MESLVLWFQGFPEVFEMTVVDYIFKCGRGTT